MGGHWRLYSGFRCARLQSARPVQERGDPREETRTECHERKQKHRIRILLLLLETVRVRVGLRVRVHLLGPIPTMVTIATTTSGSCAGVLPNAN